MKLSHMPIEFPKNLTEFYIYIYIFIWYTFDYNQLLTDKHISFIVTLQKLALNVESDIVFCLYCKPKNAIRYLNI